MYGTVHTDTTPDSARDRGDISYSREVIPTTLHPLLHHLTRINPVIGQNQMASPPLIVRNLTARPVELKGIEYYDALPNLSQNALSNITSNFTSLLRKRNQSPPTAAHIAGGAQTFSSRDVSIRVEPFNSTRTDVQPRGTPLQSLRLTFEADSERHRLDNLAPSTSSTVLTPLSPNPRQNFTAVYLPRLSQLTLYSSTHLSSWMRKLKDDTPLSALSIPGTHNSPTCHRALPSVRCQATSPPEQLDNGVRFFDVRVQPENPKDLSKDRLVLVHSVFPISLTGPKYFRDLVNEIFAFLDRNPSETVILSVKREGPGDATDAQLSRILRDHYAGDVNHWFTAPRIPTLGEARHKIVLMRRFALEDGLKQEWEGAGWCINAENWADNTPHALCPSGHVCVQDFYEVTESENIEKKIKYCQDQLARAAQCVHDLPKPGMAAASPSPKHPLYINFLTASSFWKVDCWPENVAQKINPAIVEYLCTKHPQNEVPQEAGADRKNPPLGDGSTGIVVCDWVGYKGNWDLVRCIVGMNAKLEMREHST